MLLEGRPHEALPLLTRGLDAYRATGAGLALPSPRHPGDAYLQAGRPDDATGALEKGLAVQKRSDELAKGQGCTALRVSRLRNGYQAGKAEDSPPGDRNGARPTEQTWELRATTTWPASASKRIGTTNAADAFRHIASVHRRFDTPDLKCARALLNELDTLK